MLSGLSRRVSRRSILSGSAMLLGGVIAACAAPAPTATPVPAKPAEPAKPAAAAPAAAPTTAPAAAAPTTAPAAAAKPTEAPKPAEVAKPAAAAPAAAPAGSKAPVELRIHDWAQDPNDIFYGPFWKNFEEKNPNIKIKREWFPRDDMHTKQLSLAATGQIGDTVRINVAVLTPELRQKGVIQSLTPFIQKDTKWATEDQKQFFPGNIANYTAEGQQWGYPVVGHPGCLQYYTNTTMAEKLGIKLPTEANKYAWTLDEAVKIFQTGTQKGADGRVSVYGFQPCLGNEGTVGVLRAHKGDVYDAEGKKVLIGTPESTAGLQWIYDLYNTHKVAIPLEAGGKQPDPAQLFPGEKVLVHVSTSGQAGNFKRLVADKFKWTILPPPIGPEGKVVTQISSDGYGMSKATKNPDEAWQVVKAYASREHGVDRHIAGFGSPGSRYDVWTDPKFKAEQPILSSVIYNTLLNPDTAPPTRAWHHPANGRYFEADSAMNNIINDMVLGNKKPAEAAAEAQKAMQAILDKPPV